jgi:hypothetical protein
MKSRFNPSNHGENMFVKCISFLPLVAASIVGVNILDVKANPPDFSDIAELEAVHQKVEGVVTDRKSGLYTVTTSTGTKYKLPESVDVRYGRDVPKLGNEMILLLNEGNLVMDAIRKGTSIKTHFVSGELVLINYGQSQMTLSMPEGEKSFKLRPESRLFKAFPVGAPVTLVLNEAGEVTCFQVSRTSDVPRNALNHVGKNSALQGFRHLGREPE